MESGKPVPEKLPSSRSFSKLLIGGAQVLLLIAVLGILAILGMMLFRQSMLERYLYKKTGYTCTIEGFDFDPKGSYLELHNVTIWNHDPYPHTPLSEVRRVRLEWAPAEFPDFPSKLKLFDIDVQSITVIRLNGNRFNILDFVEAIDRAWGGDDNASSSLRIDECRVRWDYVITLDEEKDGRRMELLLEYSGEHQNVTRLTQITDPPMELAKSKVEGFYFFNYFEDSVRNLFR